jgi:hypothetical protein
MGVTGEYPTGGKMSQIPSADATDDRQILGNEIFERIREIGRKEFESALLTVQKLARREEVSDGELLDALHEFTVHLDMFNPLLPIASEVFERYMDKCGMAETPRGIKREWFEEESQ